MREYTPEVGGRIASDEALTKQYELIVAQNRPSPLIASQLHTRLETVLVPCIAAVKAKNAAYVPTSNVTSELQSIEQETAKASSAYQEHHQALQAILDEVSPLDPRAKKIKPQDLVDSRYLDEMQKGGFFDQLWGGKK